ncbi:MAG TPA: thrombospondin type 3 repeat-containing protein [Terriglobales bacterium]
MRRFALALVLLSVQTGICTSAQGIPAENARNASGDKDADGIADVDDNCPYWWNPDQKDSKADGIGDVCRVVEQAKEELARLLGGNSAVLGISVRHIRAVVWTDECLGRPRPGETCNPRRIAGFRVRFVVSAMEAREYTAHTDLTRTVRFRTRLPGSATAKDNIPAPRGSKE